MGRTSTFRKAGGGGFLNNVDGTITGYDFTTTFPFASKNPTAKKSDFNSLFFVLSARVDGAEADVTTTLWAGSADDFEISDDGHVLTPIEDGAVLSGGTPLSKFIETYEAHGEGASSDDETVIDYTPLINQRVRFVQEPLSADEVASLKRRGKPYQQQDKKDPKKFWPIKELTVAAVYGPAEVVPAGKSAKVAGKVAGKASKAAVIDVAEEAGAALVGYIQAAGGTIQKTKLRMKVLTDAAFKATPQVAKDVATWLSNDDNLKVLEGVAYSIKTGLLTLKD